MPKTVVIRSTSRERATYEFSVSEKIEFGERADPETVDQISGRTASGMVAKYGIDDYRFEGEITDFSVSGSATVSVDGEQVEPEDFGTDRVTISGELLKEDSVRPLADSTVKAIRPDSRDIVAATYTDDQGRYELSVPRMSDPLDIVMYQAHDIDPRSPGLTPRGTAMPEDGTEDIFPIARVDPSRNHELPTRATGLAFPFDILVEDQNNRPVEGALVTVNYRLPLYEKEYAETLVELTDTTTDSGLFKVTGCNKTGMELTTREITVVVEPPPGNNDFSADRLEHTLEISASGTSNVLRIELP